jgi:hypothetical protein
MGIRSYERNNDINIFLSIKNNLDVENRIAFLLIRNII